MDYLIDEKEFIEHESEIILSGCIREFLVPNIYRESGKIYWVYSDMKAASLGDYSNKDIRYIQSLTKNYMLNPEKIVFHPSRIFRQGEKWMYHYVPSTRDLMYRSSDLKRYLVLENCAALDDTNEETVNISTIRNHILYNKKTGKIEKLMLKNTFIGGRRGKIDVDFNGELKIDCEGNVMLLSGEAFINQVLMEQQKNYRLNEGDAIQFSETELIYW